MIWENRWISRVRTGEFKRIPRSSKGNFHRRPPIRPQMSSHRAERPLWALCPYLSCLFLTNSMLRPSQAWSEKSGCTLRNDKDEEINQSLLNTKVRWYAYLGCAAYAVHRRPTSYGAVADSNSKSATFMKTPNHPHKKDNSTVSTIVHFK